MFYRLLRNDLLKSKSVTLTTLLFVAAAAMLVALAAILVVNLSGAIDTLLRSGAVAEDLDVARVPGAFEIPLVAKKMASTQRYDAIICLGVVIRGATPHFDVVVNEVSKGSAQVGLETGVPVLFGVEGPAFEAIEIGMENLIEVS